MKGTFLIVLGLGAVACGGRVAGEAEPSEGGAGDADVTDSPLAGPSDGGAPSCPSGVPAGINCGVSRVEPCCETMEVPGGTFLRGYDGVYATDGSHPATVSTFRLDRFEVTVSRFRQFVAAVLSGWHPAAAAGKHTHLNGGRGLADVGGGGYESGWDPSWDGNLPNTKDAWTSYLQCKWRHTWTQDPGPNEDLPIDCADLYEAYAFCIWDGGFLPSATEWNYRSSSKVGAA